MYDNRPITQQAPVQSSYTTTETVNDYQTVLQTQTSTINTTHRSTQDLGPRTFAAFTGNSINAGNGVVIQANNDVSIHGVVNSTANSITANAGNDLSIMGLTPTGGAADEIPAQAKILAPGTITLTATNTVTVDSNSLVGGTSGNSITAQSVDVTADSANLSGGIYASSTFTATAGTDVALDGTIDSGTTLTIDAGQGSTHQGNITGTINTALTASGTNSQVTLASGSSSGSISLTSSDVSAINGTVSLTAAGGSVTQSGGVVLGGDLVGDAQSGFTANTSVLDASVSITGAGNIVLTNTSALINGSINLDALQTANGTITVTAVGDVTAKGVVTSGSSSGNSITIDSTGNFTVALPTGSPSGTNVISAAGGAANVTLTAAGAISSATGAQIRANNLTVTAGDNGSVSASLYTDINNLSLTTTQVGNVTVTDTNPNGVNLTNVKVLAGTLTVTAAGNLTATSVISETDGNPNGSPATSYPLSLTSTNGNILVGYIQGGAYQNFYAANAVSLNAHGSISETTNAPTPSLIADTLTLAAGTGINGLETAINTLASANTKNGSISIYNTVNSADSVRNLTVTSATADDAAHTGSVSILIQTQGDLTADHESATGANSAVRLVSTNGNLTIPSINGVTPISAAGISLIARPAYFTGAIVIAPHSGGDTITRTDGRNWVDDGFAPGQKLTLTGTDQDNSYYIDSISGNVITLATANTLTAETTTGTVTGTSVTNTYTGNVTFARNATGDTITRTDGNSWADAGFTAGQQVTLSALNAGTYTIKGVSGNVLTLTAANRLTATSGTATLTGHNSVGNYSGSVTYATAAGGDTLTRNDGSSWSDYGFNARDVISIVGTLNNRTTYTINSVSGNVATLTVANTITAGTDTGAVISASRGSVQILGNVTGYSNLLEIRAADNYTLGVGQFTGSITFARSGSGDTVTRNDGASWTAAGFAAGQIITLSGTSQNNGVYTILGFGGTNNSALILTVKNTVTAETDTSATITSNAGTNYTAASIILETGTTLNVPGTLTATQLVQLTSDDGNVSISGMITGGLKKLEVAAYGSDPVITNVLDPVTDFVEYVDSSNRVYLNDSSNHFYTWQDPTTGLYPFQGFHTGASQFTGGSIRFAQNSGGDTITRNDGSNWASAGFAVGQTITVTGTSKNNGSYVVKSIGGTNNSVLTLAGSVRK